MTGDYETPRNVDALRLRPKTPEGRKLSDQIGRVAAVYRDSDEAAGTVLGIGENPDAAVICSNGHAYRFSPDPDRTANLRLADDLIARNGGIGEVILPEQGQS